MRRFLLFLGVLVATSSFPHSAFTFVGMPDKFATPDRVLAEGTAPNGGSASDGTVTGGGSLEMYSEPDSGNIRTVNGSPTGALQVTGNPSSSTSYTVDTELSGAPNSTARYSMTVDSVKYGANEPYVLTTVDTIQTAASPDYHSPRAITTPDSLTHVVFEDRTTGSGRLAYHRWSLVDEDRQTTSSGVTVWNDVPATTMGSNSYFAAPSIWFVETAKSATTDPGYRLYVSSFFATAYDSGTGAGTITLRISHSDDKGATWTSLFANLQLTFNSSTPLEFDQAHAVFDPAGQQVVMKLRENDNGTYTLRTFTSNDPSGGFWTELTNGTIANIKQSQMVTYCGRQVLSTRSTTSSNLIIYGREAFSSDWVQLASLAASADRDLQHALAVNPNGWFYLFYRSLNDEDEIYLYTSVDGENWGDATGPFPYNDGSALLVLDEDADSGTTTLANGLLLEHATWGLESVQLLGSLITSGTTVDDSILMFTLGRYSNQTTDGVPTAENAVAYGGMLPTTKSPQYQAFTGAATQDADHIDSEGRLVYNISASSQQGYNDYRPLNDPEVCGADWAIGPDSTGGSTGNQTVAMQIKCHDTGNTNNYGVEARIATGTGAIQLYDVVAGGVIVGATGSYDNSKPVIIRGTLNGNNGDTAWYFRNYGDVAWTQIGSSISLTSTGGGITSSILWGTISSGTADIDTLFFLPYGGNTASFVSELAAGTNPLVPIRATTQPQRTWLSTDHFWRGSLSPGDSFDVSSISDAPVQRLSPLTAYPSPSLPHEGDCSAGATYRIVYDCGSDYVGRISKDLVHLSGFNLHSAGYAPIAEARLRRWTGSAWSTFVTLDNSWQPFGAANSATFTHAAGSSLFQLTSGNSRVFMPTQLNDAWIRFDDGLGNRIGARVVRTHMGQSTGTGLTLGVEIDLSEMVTEAGNFASMTNGAAGTVTVYPTDARVNGTQGTDSTRYYAVEWDIVPSLPSSITRYRIGSLPYGPDYVLANQERAGASLRRAAPDVLTTLPGSAIRTARRTQRKPVRRLEMNFERVLVQLGTYGDGDGVVNEFGFDGSTGRMTVDGVPQVIMGVHELVGQRYPVSIAINVPIEDDPGTTSVTHYGQDVMFGRMESQVDRTVSRGQLFGRTHGHHSGTRLVITEEV